MKTIRMNLSCLLIAVVMAFGLDCKKVGDTLAEKFVEKTVEKASGGKAKVSIGTNVDISGLAEVLRYPGAKAVGHWSVAQEKDKGLVYVLESTDSAATIAAYYRKKLTGWKELMSMNTDKGMMINFQSSDQKETAVITISFDDDKKKSSLNIVYVKKG